MKHVNDSHTAAAIFKTVIAHPEQEELFTISLNSANVVKDIHFVGLGSDTSVIISPKVIAKYAVLDMAAGVIIAHTHPSGNPKPSMADIEQTEKLREALKLFDINLLDHVVMAGDKYFSFTDNDINEI